MTPFRGVRWIAALMLLGGAALPANAAWDNVFQVCCFGCNKQPAAASYYAPQAACCPQPQQVCCTQYVQRSYYQPVTCYQTQTYYQPVTTYRTSYYYEPVTTYRYSCYYDPCTCSYKQIACPQTCYRLRSQCCPVTSYLQRTCQVPVTSYRLSYYYEPVTTCTDPCAQASAAQPAAVAPVPAVGENTTPYQGAPQYQAAPYPAPSSQPPPAAQPQPGIHEGRTAPPPANDGSSGIYNRYSPPTPQQPNPMPPATGNPQGYRPAVPAAQPPRVRLDRIVAVPKDENSSVGGQVVRTDNTPQSHTAVTFVSLVPQGPRQTVTADRDGRFQVILAPGGWLVYLPDQDGKPAFHSKIEVRDDRQQMLLVSR